MLICLVQNSILHVIFTPILSSHPSLLRALFIKLKLLTMIQIINFTYDLVAVSMLSNCAKPPDEKG
jgi:hypothetical protein